MRHLVMRLRHKGVTVGGKPDDILNKENGQEVNLAKHIFTLRCSSTVSRAALLNSSFFYIRGWIKVLLLNLSMSFPFGSIIFEGCLCCYSPSIAFTCAKCACNF
jgi:hypothetical protein